jgi:alcohol dehydrogenase class IV
MREFHIKMGFKGTIADIGLTKKDIPTLVEATLDCPGMKGLISLSPVKCEDSDIAKIFG